MFGPVCSFNQSRPGDALPNAVAIQMIVDAPVPAAVREDLTDQLILNDQIL